MRQSGNESIGDRASFLSERFDAIAITDHNTTLQCPEIQSLGERFGLRVFAGVEVTTREEAHCLVYFPTDESVSDSNDI